MKEKISANQAGLMLALLLFANKIINLPSLLSTFAKGDSIFIVLIYFLIEIGVIFIFFRLKKQFPEKSFFDILKEKLSIVTAWIVYLSALIYFYTKIFLTFFSGLVYFKTEVYLESQEIFFLVTTLVLTFCLVHGGFRALGRSAEFFFIPIIVGLIFCQIISLSNFKEVAILFDSDAKLFFTGAFRFIFIFGDSIFLFFIMNKIALEKKWQKKIIYKVMFIMFVIISGYSIFFSIFQYTGFMHTNAVSDIITLSYQLFYIGRLDSIAVVVLMVMTIFQIAIYSSVFCECMQKLMVKSNTKFNLIIFNILFLIGYFLIYENYGSVLNAATKDLIFFAVFLQIALPIITLFFKKKKKEGYCEKNF